MEHPVPKVGHVVCLNDNGLMAIYGHVAGLAHMKTLRMKITSIDMDSMTEPEKTYLMFAKMVAEEEGLLAT